MKKQEQKLQKTPKKSSLRGLHKPEAYIRFVQWFASPEPLRIPRTRQELAKEMRIGADSLTEYTKREGFEDAVMAEWKKWGFEKTSNVLAKLYQSIIEKGASAEIKLWLQFFLEWQEKITAKIESEDIKKLTEEISKITESWKKDDDTRDHESDGSGTPADGGGQTISSEPL